MGTKVKTCVAKDCDFIASARGYCPSHLSWFHRTGGVGAPPALTDNPRCKIENCNRRKSKDGYCKAHALRIAKYGQALPEVPIGTKGKKLEEALGVAGRSCTLNSCELPYFAGGYCRAHKSRYDRFGDVQEHKPLTLRPRSEEIGRRTNKHGYVLIKKAGHPNANARGWIMEHRYVMSEIIGRPLTGDENVHHINGHRSDNRVANLELWNTSQPSGQRVADKVAWAKQILAMYPEG